MARVWTVLVTCAHRPLGAAFSVIRTAGPLDVSVTCPCCHLPGYRECGDLEPMFCPYCGVPSIDTDEDSPMTCACPRCCQVPPGKCQESDGMQAFTADAPIRCDCRWTPGIDLPTSECATHRDDPTLAHRPDDRARYDSDPAS